jgi:two-component system, OmpR family, alkaline phosphatase synthesis response regulator PhoP
MSSPHRFFANLTLHPSRPRFPPRLFLSRSEPHGHGIMASSESLRPAGSLRLLVAEDEPHIRRILITLLEGRGFLVDAAASGIEALSRIESDLPYDLVLTDVMMPGATGIDLLRAIRNLPHRTGTPVLVLTAKGQDADRNEALQLGAADFMTKPFSPKKFLQRIDQILEGR